METPEPAIRLPCFRSCGSLTPYVASYAFSVRQAPQKKTPDESFSPPVRCFPDMSDKISCLIFQVPELLFSFFRQCLMRRNMRGIASNMFFSVICPSSCAVLLCFAGSLCHCQHRHIFPAGEIHFHCAVYARLHCLTRHIPGINDFYPVFLRLRTLQRKF